MQTVEQCKKARCDFEEAHEEAVVEAMHWEEAELKLKQFSKEMRSLRSKMAVTEAELELLRQKRDAINAEPDDSASDKTAKLRKVESTLKAEEKKRKDQHRQVQEGYSTAEYLQQERAATSVDLAAVTETLKALRALESAEKRAVKAVKSHGDTIFMVRDTLTAPKNASFRPWPKNALNAVARARVPVIKASETVFAGIAFDIVVNNQVALRNSQLLRTYASIDPRARQLMFLVKSWAKKNKLNEAPNGTPASYTHMVLVLFFLTTRPEGRILPNLQMLARETGAEPFMVEGIDTSFCEDVEFARQSFEYPSPPPSIAKLLLEYFEWLHWLVNRAEGITVSLREGKLLRNKHEIWSSTKLWRLSVEDPFEHHDSILPHDLGQVVSQEGQTRLKDAVLRTLKDLHQTLDAAEAEVNQGRLQAWAATVGAKMNSSKTAKERAPPSKALDQEASVLPPPGTAYSDAVGLVYEVLLDLSNAKDSSEGQANLHLSEVTRQFQERAGYTLCKRSLQQLKAGEGRAKDVRHLIKSFPGVVRHGYKNSHLNVDRAILRNAAGSLQLVGLKKPRMSSDVAPAAPRPAATQAPAAAAPGADASTETQAPFLHVGLAFEGDLPDRLEALSLNASTEQIVGGSESQPREAAPTTASQPLSYDAIVDTLLWVVLNHPSSLWIGAPLLKSRFFSATGVKLKLDIFVDAPGRSGRSTDFIQILMEHPCVRHMEPIKYNGKPSFQWIPGAVPAKSVEHAGKRSKEGNQTPSSRRNKRNGRPRGQDQSGRPNQGNRSQTQEGQREIPSAGGASAQGDGNATATDAASHERGPGRSDQGRGAGSGGGGGGGQGDRRSQDGEGDRKGRRGTGYRKTQKPATAHRRRPLPGAAEGSGGGD